MALKTSIFLVGDESIALGCVRRQLAGEDGYQVEARAFSYSEAVERLKYTSGNRVAVIEIERDPDKAYRLAEEISFQLPDVHLVMTSPRNDPELILRAMRAGAEGYLPQPLINERY